MQPKQWLPHSVVAATKSKSFLGTLTAGRGVFLLSNGDGYNQEPDWTDDIRGNGNVTGPSTLARLDFLTSQSTLYIGSTEGQHRSRAKYLYIRVVRKH